MNSLQDIERAIDALQPQAELYARLDPHRPAGKVRSDATVFEQGLGFFGSPEDNSSNREQRRSSSDPKNRWRFENWRNG